MIEHAKIIAQQGVLGYEPLTPSEKETLEQMMGDPAQIQRWIDSNVTYTLDEKQFYPSQCADTEHCDYWAPVAHLLRSRREDCDGILALAHYALRKTGFGLYLSSDDAKNDSAHVVYVYSQEGKFGIISVNDNEASGPKFSSLNEVSTFISSRHQGKYTFFKKVALPYDDSILLYGKEGIEPQSDYESVTHEFMVSKAK